MIPFTPHPNPSFRGRSLPEESLLLLGSSSDATPYLNVRVPYPSRLLRRVGSYAPTSPILRSGVCPSFCRDRFLRRSALGFVSSLGHRNLDSCSTHPHDSSPHCHPDRSVPAFSSAPFSGAPGRVVEGSRLVLSQTPIPPTPRLARRAVALSSLQLLTLDFQLFTSSPQG